MSSPRRSRNPKWSTHARVTSARAVSVRRCRVEVISGADAGVTCAAEGGELAIGTAPGNHLVLTDPAVSRHHCTIEATEAGFLLRDLSSTNGTLLGGFRIVGAYLEPGAVISVGESSVRFESLEEQIEEPLSRAEAFGSAVGASAAMRRVFAMMERIAPTDSTVLLTGETGTGKGVLAEALHAQSPRAGGPFVVVDCGAVPETLIESELFGHERGSFTGADQQRIGAFELASGGTLFLDELGELGLEMQPRLLRVLEKREVRRVGGTQTIPVDVRIVAATNRDLRREVNAGTFRSDLFYRLNVMRIEIPPLRERPEDVPLLATTFYRLLSGDDAAVLEPDLLSHFMRQRWPGNVRELRTAVERAVVLGTDAARVGPPAGGSEPLDFTISYRDAKDSAVTAWEARYVPELVRRYDGNLSRAARAVSMDRNHLRKLLRRYRDE